MRKVFLILMINMLILPAFAQDITPGADTGSYVIEDEILKSKYFPANSEPSYKEEKSPIEDELLVQPFYKDSLFRLSVYKQGEYSEIPIEDELINDDFISKASTFIFPVKDIPDDYFIERSIDVTKVRKIRSKIKYDFTKKQVPIRIRIANHLKSTKELSEGSTIPFVALDDFEIRGKKYENGTTILGRVETISDSDKMGVPETLRIDNFYIKNGDEEIDLYGGISKTGANRSIWVYPLYQAGNICLYAAGFVFVPIHGGRAKLSTSETFTIFYEGQ